ncbi:hypothetical protein HZS_4871, partial [Henneguya salminicola]
MAEPKLYNLINNSLLFDSFLLEHNLIFDPDTISQLNFTCRNANSRDPNKGFKSSTRKRNLTQRNAERFLEEGQGVLKIDCLKCKSCKTTLSPRSGEFLTYFDFAKRSNYWIAQRPMVDSIETLGLAKPTVVDCHNFCRRICQFENGMVHHTLLGDGYGRGPSGETLRIVIQIDESLLRERRMEMKLSRQMTNESLPICKNGGEEVNINRNFGKRIAGPWIFGMVECHKQPDVGLYHVDGRDANTLLPIIRDNVTPGSVVWSVQWPAYRRIWEEDGMIH